MTRTIAAAMTAAAVLVATAVVVGTRPDPSAPPSADRAASESARPVTPLSPPRGETVLTITGVTRGNAGPRTAKADLAALDRLPQQQLTIHEPFVKKDVTFRGVRMSDLLRSAGVPSSARELHMHALDDYTVDLPVAGVKSDGLLATHADGKRIPVAGGGPIRLVFDSEGELGSNPDNWIWSIDSIRPTG